MRKGEIACYKQFFPFSHNVFYSYISFVRQNAVLCGNGLNPLSDDKILVLVNLKAFADDKFSITKIPKYVSHSVVGENWKAQVTSIYFFFVRASQVVVLSLN